MQPASPRQHEEREHGSRQTLGHSHAEPIVILSKYRLGDVTVVYGIIMKYRLGDVTVVYGIILKCRLGDVTSLWYYIEVQAR